MEMSPLLPVEITIPAEFVDTVSRDLTARGGRVARTARGGESTTIVGEIPTAEVQEYGNVLRSLTAGRGTFHAGHARPPR